MTDIVSQVRINVSDQQVKQLKAANEAMQEYVATERQRLKQEGASSQQRRQFTTESRQHVRAIQAMEKATNPLIVQQEKFSKAQKAMNAAVKAGAISYDDAADSLDAYSKELFENTKALDRNSKSQDRNSKAAGSLSKNLGELGRTLNRIIIVWAAFEAAQLAFEFVKAGDSVKLLDTRLQQASGGLVVLEDIYDMAQRAGISMDDMASSTARFQNALADFGTGQQTILDFTESITLMGRISGTSTQELSASFLQLSQALASNKLAGDELRSVMENIPMLARVVMDELVATGRIAVAQVEAFGSRAAAFRELAREGTINPQMLVEATVASLDKLKEQFGELPNLVEMEWARLVNTFTMFAGQMDASFNVGEKVAGMLQSVGDAFEWLTQLVQDNAGTMDDLTDAVDIQQGIWEIMTRDIRNAIEEMADWTSGMSSNMEYLNERKEDAFDFDTPTEDALSAIRRFARLMVSEIEYAVDLAKGYLENLFTIDIDMSRFSRSDSTMSMQTRDIEQNTDAIQEANEAREERNRIINESEEVRRREAEQLRIETESLNYFRDAQRKSLEMAKELQNERRKAALAADTGLGTAPTVIDEDAIKAAEKAAKAAEREMQKLARTAEVLLRRYAPMEAQTRDLAEAEQVLTRAYKEGIITLEEYDAAMEGIQEKRKAEVTEAQKLIDKLEEEVKVLKMSEQERFKYNKAQSATVELSKEEKAVVDGLVDQVWELSEAQKAAKNSKDVWSDVGRAAGDVFSDSFMGMLTGKFQGFGAMFMELFTSFGGIAASALSDSLLKPMMEDFGKVVKDQLSEVFSSLSGSMGGQSAGQIGAGIGIGFGGGSIVGQQLGGTSSASMIGSGIGTAAGLGLGTMVGNPMLGAALGGILGGALGGLIGQSGQDKYSISFSGGLGNLSANAGRDAGPFQQFVDTINDIETGLVEFASSVQRARLEESLAGFATGTTRMAEGSFDASKALEMVGSRIQMIVDEVASQFSGELMSALSSGNDSAIEGVLLDISAAMQATDAWGKNMKQVNHLLRVHNEEGESLAETYERLNAEMEQAQADMNAALDAMASLFETVVSNSVRFAEIRESIGSTSSAQTLREINRATEALMGNFEMLRSNGGSLSSQLDALDSALTSAERAIAKQAEIIQNELNEAITKANDSYQEQTEGINEWREAQEELIRDAAERSIEYWENQVEESKARIEASREAINILNDQLRKTRELGQAWENAASAADSLVGALGSSSAIPESVQLETIRTTVATLRSQMGGATGAERAALAAQLAEALQSELRLTESVFGSGSSEFLDAFNRINQEAYDLQEEIARNLEQQQKKEEDIQSRIEKHEKAIEAHQDKIEAYQDKIALEQERTNDKLDALRDSYDAKMDRAEAQRDAAIAAAERRSAIQMERMRQQAEKTITAIEENMSMVQQEMVAAARKQADEALRMFKIATEQREIMKDSRNYLYQMTELLKGMPAYQNGTDYVPKTGLALIHRGEAVVPASENRVTVNVNGGGEVGAIVAAIKEGLRGAGISRDIIQGIINESMPGIAARGRYS